jgi:hypothetical protein
MEIFKDIEGYEGLYQVSNYGNIKSLGNGNANNPNWNKERILKYSKNTNKYCSIVLSKNGVSKTKTIHRLVAKAFLLNPQNKSQINHIDCNKENNTISNLEWCTSSENNFHRYANGLHFQLKGKDNKLSTAVIQYDLDGNFIKEWESQNEVRRQLGFKQGQISECCHNKRVTANGYKWKFKI